MPQPAFASSIITGPIVSSAISDTGAAMDLGKGRDQVLLQGKGKAPGIDQAPALAPEAGRVRPAEARGLQADQSPEGPARDRQAAQAPQALDRVRPAPARTLPAPVRQAPARALLAPVRQAPVRALLVLDQVLPALDRAPLARAMERDRAPGMARGPLAPDRHRDPVMAPAAFAASRVERQFSQRTARSLSKILPSALKSSPPTVQSRSSGSAVRPSGAIRRGAGIRACCLSVCPGAPSTNPRRIAMCISRRIIRCSSTAC
jgi:hypothetical protein